MSDLPVLIIMGLAFICGAIYSLALEARSWPVALLATAAYGLLALAAVLA